MYIFSILVMKNRVGDFRPENRWCWVVCFWVNEPNADESSGGSRGHGDWSVFLSLGSLRLSLRWTGFNISICFYWVCSFKGFLCCRAEYCPVISITKDSTARHLFLILCPLLMPLQLRSRFTNHSHCSRGLRFKNMFTKLSFFNVIWSLKYEFVEVINVINYHVSTS